MRSIIVIFITALLSTAAGAQTFVGPAFVQDGDSIKIGGQKIRLWGVDAVEGKQICSDGDGRQHRCGRDATRALVRLLGSRTVTCHQVDTDRFKRAVSVCAVGDVEINRWLVRQGWAIDYAEYSKGAYAAEMQLARTEKLGNWITGWQLPANYRRCLKTRGGSVDRCSAQ